MSRILSDDRSLADEFLPVSVATFPINVFVMDQNVLDFFPYIVTMHRFSAIFLGGDLPWQN
jgi:hypothetical protein